MIDGIRLLLHSALTASAVAIPITIGIVQMAKRFGMPSHWAPIMALSVGMAYTALLALHDTYALFVEDVIAGTTVALAACGAYSGAKAVTRSDERAMEVAE